MRTLLFAGAALLMGGGAQAAEPEARGTARTSVAPPAMQTWAPGLARYTDDVLFGDVWLRSDLSPRDRSFATITALIATGNTGPLAGHLGRALDNGVKPIEVSGLVTHLAFYTGWPSAVSALGVMDEVLKARGVPPPPREAEASPPTEADAGRDLTVVRPGRSPEPGPPERFTGTVTVSSRFEGDGDSRLGGANVRFEPGARTFWHSHAGGQLLVVVSGEGRVQAEGGPVRAIRPGDVIWTPPGVRHWHGAAPTVAMTHAAMSEATAGEATNWLGPVDEAVYRAAPQP